MPFYNKAVEFKTFLSQKHVSVAFCTLTIKFVFIEILKTSRTHSLFLGNEKKRNSLGFVMMQFEMAFSSTLR